MPVISDSHDLGARTLTLVAEFAAPVERVWAVYADPRQLEQVWAPEGLTTQIPLHELRPGGHVHYAMSDPEGNKYCGYWEVLEVEEPNRIVLLDGFADEDFQPNPEMPASHNVFAFEPIEGGTRATYTCTFNSTEELQQVLEMGVIEGSTSATNQIDGLLARS